MKDSYSFFCHDGPDEIHRTVGTDAQFMEGKYQ